MYDIDGIGTYNLAKVNRLIGLVYQTMVVHLLLSCFIIIIKMMGIV